MIRQKVSVVCILWFMGGFTFPNQQLVAQTLWKQKKQKISCYEKWWAVSHPFIAKKAFNLTHYSLMVTDSIGKTKTIDGNINGGQLDAFKHAYWMAMLAQNFKWRKAQNLGLAHEKANYRSFVKASKKGIIDGHDQVSTDMDIWNNEKGIAIGLACKCFEQNLLQQVVLDSIRSGSMRIIRMNSGREFLDSAGKVIPPENYKGKWINDKCLVPSNIKE